MRGAMGSSRSTSFAAVRVARSATTALAALLAGTFGAKSARALDSTHLAAVTKPSVVLVSLYDPSGQKEGSGTGFFVSADGKLVTNHHVIAEAARATVTLADGREVAVRGVLADDKEHDVAILQVEGAGYPALTLGDTTMLHAGEDIVVIGSPLGLSTTISTGIVAAVRGEGLSKEAGFEKDYSKGTSAWGLQSRRRERPGRAARPS